MSIDSKLRQILFDLGFPPTSGADTPVFIFSSAELKHVWIALQHRKWAVADIVSDQLRARITKARQMPLGASGLFYCSDAECFTVPFRIQSHPELADISDVWPGVWHFPFEIDPLGDLSKRIRLRDAKATWRALEGVSNVTKRINISGSMAFVPSWLYREDWDLILRTLSTTPTESNQAMQRTAGRSDA